MEKIENSIEESEIKENAYKSRAQEKIDFSASNLKPTSLLIANKSGEFQFKITVAGTQTVDGVNMQLNVNDDPV